MNNKLRNKLLDLEVSPPAAAWQKLAAELESSIGDRSLAIKLKELEPAVPSTAWTNISSVLEPVTELDLSAKLREAAVSPPLSAWSAIEKSLNSPKKKYGWLRLTAAAAIAGLLFYSAYFLTYSPKKELAATKVPADKKASWLSNTNELPVLSREQLDDRAQEQEKKVYASLDQKKKKISHIAAGYRFSSGMIRPEADGNMAEAINQRYVVLMTPDGNFIRVSKKLGDLVCCVSGEENDPNCKEQVGKWQKQLAAADLSHTGDFADILGIVSALQEGN